MTTERRTGRGRPPVGPAIQIRLTIDQLTAIDRFASEQKMSRAGAVRDLIRSALQVEQR